MKPHLEHLIVIAACITLLWIGIGDIWGHRIHHDFPYSYLATDPFQHQTRAQWIKDAGHYQYEAPYYSGGLTDVVGFYPPLLNHLAVILSHLSGQEVHDVIILIPVLLVITATLLTYTTFRNINPALALLTLPFSTFFFTVRETLVAFFWGHWPALVGDFFLYFSCIALLDYHKKNRWIVVATLIIGTILAHTAAFVFAALFFILWTAYTYTLNTKEKPEKKQLILTTLLILITTIYFLNLFRQSWMIIHAFKFEIITDWSGGGGFFQLAHLGIAKYLLLAGIPLALFLARKQKIFLLSLFFLLAGFGNYAGLTIRAFNLRFYWPLMLAPLLALPIYFVIKKNNKKTIIAAALCILLFTGFVYFNYKRSVDQSGYMNKYIWENLLWLRENTPEDATIYFGYGDYYDQDAGLGNAQRIFSRTETEDFVPLFKQKNITRHIPIKLFAEAGAGLPHKTGLFSYGLYLKEDTDYLNNHKNRDLCTYDYYVFDRTSQYVDIATFSLQYAQHLMDSGHFDIVHDNQWSVILHNKQPGEECLEA